MISLVSLPPEEGERFVGQRPPRHIRDETTHGLSRRGTHRPARQGGHRRLREIVGRGHRPPVPQLDESIVVATTIEKAFVAVENDRPQV